MSCNSDGIFVLLRSAPSQDLEAAELALALAAFDEPVQVILQREGLFWLLEQQARKAGGKSANKVLAAFALYDIALFANQDDAPLLSALSLMAPQSLHWLTSAEIANKIQQAKHCFSF
ncbi:MAG: hypothetical protein RL217_1274 [Pseudomonadota bacterium]